MTYDFFLSYSSQDRPWAQRLADDLVARGQKVFFDQNSLRAGAEWEPALQQALSNSARLICLWSVNANQSAWVQAEIAHFRTKLQSSDFTGRLLLVPLDEQPNSLGRLQNPTHEALKRGYAAGNPSAVSGAEWRTFIDWVIEQRPDDATVQMPVAILTLDAKSAGQLTPEALQEASGLAIDAATLKARYNGSRLDWRPFKGGDTIGDYLDQARKEINAWLGRAQGTNAESVTWRYPDEKRFWTELEYVREFAGLMEGGQPGLIVIDPFAAPQTPVQARLKLFERCLRFGHVGIVTLHPSLATNDELAFRRWVAESTLVLLEAYDSPRPVPDVPLTARTAIVANNVGEMLRVMKTTIGDRNRSRLGTGAPTAAAIRN